MERELVCKWLGLPPERWPPDHYALLGLPVGETDIHKIEEHTHDRLARLRQHQLHHPEQVTEAMNCLAQAFSCLTDPKAKQAYDATLGLPSAAPSSTEPAKAPEVRRSSPVLPIPKLPAPPTREAGEKKSDGSKSSPAVPIPKLPVAPPPVLPAPTAAEASLPPPPAAPSGETAAATTSSPDPLAWLFGPWGAPVERDVGGTPTSAAAPAPTSGTPSPEAAPVVVDWKKEPPPTRVSVNVSTPEVPAQAEPEAPVVIPPPVDATPPAGTARELPRDARRGLGTKRQMYHRLATTRQLINAWKRSGRFLANPERRLTRLADANDLLQEFADIEELLRQFPRVMGEAGQPGYLVLALAKQPSVVPTFRGLSASQREALARDWNAALDVLLQHRDFLREEVRSLRKKSRWARTIRAASAFCSDHALSVLICAGVLALLLGVWTYYRYRPY